MLSILQKTSIYGSNVIKINVELHTNKLYLNVDVVNLFGNSDYIFQLYLYGCKTGDDIPKNNYFVVPNEE